MTPHIRDTDLIFFSRGCKASQGPHIITGMSQKEDTDSQTGIIVESRTKVQKPPMYKVLLLNDDFTPMDFVVHVLKTFFDKLEPEAVEIMMNVHNRGFGVAGVYSYDIAEMKVLQVNQYSKKNEHPLKCTLEKEI